jgi:CRP-like cAMP-binding protein
MKTDPRINILSEMSLFAACRDKELAKVVSITTEIRRGAGEVLCTEGDRADECFILVEGTAVVTIAGKLVAELGPGSIIGELSLLDPGPRTATVAALTPIWMLVLSRREFTTLLYSAPDVVRRILSSMAHRLREAERVEAGVRV